MLATAAGWWLAKKRFTVPAPSAIFSVSDILGICFLARLYAAAVSIVRCCGASMRLEATRMADDRMLDERAVYERARSQKVTLGEKEICGESSHMRG